jgi:transposase
MDGLILAIDLGKFNSLCCWYDPATKAATFRSAKTGDLDRELTRVPVAGVVIEAGGPAGWVHDRCQELGLPCRVANTSAAAWQWKNVKRKTDRDDALKLARLAALGELPTVTLPPRPVRQWKSLIGLRQRLVGERGRGQNRLRGLLAGRGLAAPLGNKAWTQAGLGELALRAKPLAECAAEELWQGEVGLLLARHRFLEDQIGQVEAALDKIARDSKAVQLLLSVPGVGVRTAEVIAAHLHEGRRFRTAGEVGAYAGLVPRQYQSGQTDRRGHISKRGPKLLRAALVECAWCSLRYNAWALATWRRLVQGGVSKKKAVVALARKLLVRCWGILKSGRPWREPQATTTVTTDAATDAAAD